MRNHQSARMSRQGGPSSKQAKRAGKLRKVGKVSQYSDWQANEGCKVGMTQILTQHPKDVNKFASSQDDQNSRKTQNTSQ
jgi:hypothetical protein